MAPFFAFAANALAATILGLTIVYGLKFSTAVHVDAKVGGPVNKLQCTYLGDCKAVDVDHCFGSHQIMIIVLALGGILIADFTLWAFSLHTACLDKTCSERPRVGIWAKVLGSGKKHVFDENEQRGATSCRGESSSSLMKAVLSALACASALALFAPHKTALNVPRSLPSHPAESLMDLAASVPRGESYVTALSGFLVESAAATRDAAKQSIKAASDEVYVREPDLGTRRVHRIGDTTYQSLRTQGIGVNMASFNNYFLSGRYRENSHTAPAKGYLTSNGSWLIAPDYQFQSLEARVWGTDVNFHCEAITHSFDVQWGRGRVDARAHSRKWKQGTGEVIEIDVTHRLTQDTTQILHSTHVGLKVTPWIRQNADELIYIVTDTADSSSTEVLRCDISGWEFLTDITMHPGVLEIKNSRTDVEEIPMLRLSETRHAVFSVLEHSFAPVIDAWTAIRGTRYAKRGLRNVVFEDILTDLAQAYWSLKRQQFETSTSIKAEIEKLPGHRSAINRAWLRGTYTRLGGSAWGLILPGLLLALPVVALLRLVLFGLHMLHLRRQAYTGRWQPLLQNEEEEEIDYIDAPPPMPPPKDDVDEAPPPYRLDDLPARDAPPPFSSTQNT